MSYEEIQSNIKLIKDEIQEIKTKEKKVQDEIDKIKESLQAQNLDNKKREGLEAQVASLQARLAPLDAQLAEKEKRLAGYEQRKWEWESTNKPLQTEPVHGGNDYQNNDLRSISPSPKKSKIDDVSCVGCRHKSELLAEKEKFLFAEKEKSKLLLAEKEKLLVEKERNVVEKDNIIKFLVNDTKRLNTELAYKEGYLHCRGILEKCEYAYCTENMATWTRHDRWRQLFNNDLREIFNETVFQDQPSELLAKQVVVMYKNLSNRIHDSYGTTIKNLHINSITVKEAQIVAFVCDKIGILWESDIIDRNYKQLSKHKIENASKRLNHTIV